MSKLPAAFLMAIITAAIFAVVGFMKLNDSGSQSFSEFKTQCSSSGGYPVFINSERICLDRNATIDLSNKETNGKK